MYHACIEILMYCSGRPISFFVCVCLIDLTVNFSCRYMCK